MLTRSACHESFREPFLWISGHDLKCLTKQRSRDAHVTVDRFASTLRASLYWDDDEFFPPEDVWVDFGVEDTPCGLLGLNAADNDPAMEQLFEEAPPVFLRKSRCLDRWQEGFEDPKNARRYLKTQSFTWALTRDAGARTFSTTARNTLRSFPGIAHGKSYNVIKDFVATPLKRAPFSDPRLEGLCFTQGSIDELARGNSHYGRRPLPDHRAHCQTRLITTRDRLLHAIEGMELPCGVRQEYRVRFDRLRDADFGRCWQEYSVIVADRLRSAEPADAGERTADHLTYWIVPTLEAASFLRFELLRWQAGIETISAQADRAPSPDRFPLYAQITNGIMLSALLRIQTLSAGGGDPSTEPALWKSEWVRRHEYNGGLPQRGEGPESSGEDTEDSDESDAPRGRTVQGLGIREALEERGMCWIREDLVQTERPAFREDLVDTLALAANRALRSFRRQGPRAQIRQLVSHDTMLELFREKCIESRDNPRWT